MSLIESIKVIKILRDTAIISTKKESHNVNMRTMKSLADGVRNLKVNEVGRLVSLMDKYPHIERKIFLFNSYKDNMISNSNFYNLGTVFNILSFGSYITKNNTYIEQFIDKKNETEQHVVRGDYDIALSLIDEIDNVFGKTLWSIDTRICIWSIKGSQDEHNIIDDIDELAKENELLTPFKSLLSQKYIPLNSIDFLRNTFSKTAMEYRSSGHAPYIDTISTIISPYEYDKERNIDNVVFYSEVLNPIDKYLIFRRIFFEYFTGENKSAYDQLYVNFIEHASIVENDPTWRSINSIRNNEINVRTTKKSNEIIDLYTKGMYSSVIVDCFSSINEARFDFGLTDILVRSLAHTINVNNEEEIKEKVKSPVLRIILAMSLSLDHNHEEFNIKKNIEQSIIKFSSFEFIKCIEATAYSLHPYSNVEKIKSASLSVFCSEYTFTPKYHYFSIQKNIRSSYYPLAHANSIENLSASRLARANIEIALDDKSVELQALIKLHDELSQYSDITKSERLYLISEMYISRGALEELMEIIAKDCIENPINIVYYPLITLMDYIDTNSNACQNPSALICCYLYHTTVNPAYREKTSELLEDYLLSLSLKKPSELFLDAEKIDSLGIYILSKICTPEIMSSLIEITSNRELLVERLKIIKGLSSLKVMDQSLNEEESSIVRDLLSSKLTAQHEKSKITINTDGIIKSQLSEYKTLLYHYFMITHRNQEICDDNLVIGKNLTDAVHYSLYYQIYKDYILNNDFGVVRSLSSEIRHGVLPNQIRSVFEAYNLVTIMTSQNEYAPNEYWRDYFSQILRDKAVNRIDDAFKLFSKEVDEIIKEVTEWPKVALVHDSQDKNHVFRFEYKELSIKTLYETACIGLSSEEDISDDRVVSFMKDIENTCWIELQPSFNKMKARLNEELKPMFNNLLSQLKENVSKIHRSIHLEENIDECNRKLIEEISYIESWFKKPEYALTDVQFDIYDVVNSSLECIQAIYEPKTLHINKNFNQTEESIRIDSKPSLGLMRALLSIYSNCLKHGLSGSGTEITISIYNHSGTYIIDVTNDISSLCEKDIMSKNLISKISEYSIQDKGDKLTSEGDTGLYKIYRYLTDSYGNYSFSVLCEHSKFIQRVMIS